MPRQREKWDSTPIVSLQEPDNERAKRQKRREVRMQQTERIEEDTSVLVPSEAEEPIFQEMPQKEKTTIPTFRTPRIISQLVLQAFCFKALGIQIVQKTINGNQESMNKPSEEIHYMADVQ